MGGKRRAELADLPLFAVASGDNGHGQAAAQVVKAGKNGNGRPPAPALDPDGIDWRKVDPAAVVCSACGARDYRGWRTGFWQRGADGRLYHWCSGGRPGAWQPARLDGNGNGAR